MRITTRCFVLIVAIFALPIFVSAQSATGTLTISLTIEPSSTVLVMPNGSLKLYVANPQAANDTQPIYFPPQNAPQTPENRRPKVQLGREPKVVVISKQND